MSYSKKRVVTMTDQNQSEQEIQAVIQNLQELIEDGSMPRNVKNHFEHMIKILQSHEEVSVRINKVLNELDEVSDDTNIEAYTRTQIWGLASMLESIDTD